MAQMLGMPYSDVVIAAIIPAVLYFLSGFLMVDKVARRDDIRRLTRGIESGSTTSPDASICSSRVYLTSAEPVEPSWMRIPTAGFLHKCEFGTKPSTPA